MSESTAAVIPIRRESLTASGRALIRPEDIDRLARAPELDRIVARLRGH